MTKTIFGVCLIITMQFAAVARADTLAVSSIFESSFPDERSAEFKKSAMSDISFLTALFSIASHFLIDGGKEETLSKSIRDEFRNNSDIMYMMDECKIDLSGGVSYEDGIVYIHFRKDGIFSEARISLRDDNKPADDSKFEHARSERFFMQILKSASPHISAGNELDKFEIADNGSVVIDNKDWLMLVDFSQRLLPASVQSAFFEIVKNAFVHGNKQSRSRHITLEWKTEGGMMNIAISDEGRKRFNAESLFNMTEDQAEANRRWGARRDADGDDMWLSGYRLGLYRSNKATKAAGGVKITDVENNARAKVGTKISFSVISFREENRRLKDAKKQIILPDFSDISFDKTIESAPTIEEYYENHKDKKEVISRITHEKDPLYMGKTTYMIGNIRHLVTSGPDDLHKIIYHSEIFGSAGDRKGEVLIYYKESEKAITVMLRGAHGRVPVIPDSCAEYVENRGERGWDEMVVKIYMHWGKGVSMIDHKVSEMGLSRSSIAIMLEDSDLAWRFPDIYRCLREFFILREVDNDLRMTESRDEMPVPLGVITKINACPESATHSDVKCLENFMIYKSWAVRGIALRALRRLAEKGVIAKDRVLKNELLFETRWIEEDMAFIERLLIQDASLADEIVAGLFGPGSGKKDIKDISARWFANGLNKNIYVINIGLKDGRSAAGAISTIRHDPVGQGYDSRSIDRSQDYWKRLARDHSRLVPSFIAHRWVFDYRPRIADRELAMSDPANDPEGIGRNRWIHNDISVIVRSFVEGRDLSEILLDKAVSGEKKEKIIGIALQAYLDIWNATKDASGKGLFIGDPKPANIVISPSDSSYRATSVDLDALREFDSFESVRSTIRRYAEYAGFEIVYKDGHAAAEKEGLAAEEEAVPFVAMQDTVPSSKDESVFNKALADIDEIDGINRKLAPAVSEGKVLYHVIMRSLIPQDASFNQQNEFVTIINDINHDFPGVKEKIIAVTDEQMKDPGRLKEFLESCENGRQVALDFAVDNDKYLKSLPPGARVLIFEPKDNNLGNFRQLLGIIAALRAIQIEDYQDRIDKLLRIYRILTGSAAPSEIPSPGDSPEDFARKFRFVLPAIELHDPDSHVRLNDRLRILLRNA